MKKECLDAAKKFLADYKHDPAMITQTRTGDEIWVKCVALSMKEITKL